MIKSALGVLVGSVLLAGCTVVPKPITQSEREATASEDLKLILQAVDAKPIAALSLTEAMARGIMHNMEHRVRMLEEAVALGRMDISKFEMLPQITAQAGYGSRSNYFAAYSQSVLTGSQTLAPSTSQEKSSWNGNLGMSWDMLDFGVSYLTAHQNADRALIARERRRKATHNLMQDIRYAYWRAAAAQSLRARVKDVIVKAESALAKARQIEAENLQPALTVLKYQQSLLDIIRQLDGLNNDMNMAATELKTLLNLPPSVKVGLGFSDDVFNLGNAPLFDVNKMEDLALANRPELYEADYMERIHSKDVRKAMLNMLPGLSLTAGGYFDDNQFAYNNNWNEFGAFFSWNLVDLATGPRRKRHANMVKAAAKLQRLALSVAIISQVRLAEQNFTNSISALKRANEIQFVSEKIAKHTQAGSQSEQMSELKEIQSDVNAIYTELRQFQSYALYQNAMGRVFSSMGLDPVPSDIHKMNLEGQSAAIEARFSRWERGELPEANIVR